MERIDGSAPLPERWRGAVVAIGNFDGVHRGHQELLHIAREEARQRGVPLGVVTFEPHPRTFFRPHQPVFRITPPALKARLLAACEVDFLASLTFDRAFASKEAEAFVSDELVGRLGVSHMVTGYDFHFGHGRKGSPDTMRRLGEELGFGVTVVEQVTDDSGFAPFSSSTIREALRQGAMREAAEQLGYWWTVLGPVGHGDKRGREIGFPTVNIAMDNDGEPHQGIYAMRVRDAAAIGGEAWAGAGYVGRRPTFGKEEIVLEVHLLDFSGDLYGRELMVEFVDFIRGDRAFDDVDTLVAQMRDDCREAEARVAALAHGDIVADFPIGRLQREGRL